MTALAAAPTAKFSFTRPWLVPEVEEAIYSDKRIVVVEGATKVGKTVTAAVWLSEQAMRSPEPGRHYWWVASVYGTAEIAYNRIKRGLDRRTYRANDSKLRLTLANGAVMEFRSAEKPDNLYGEDVYDAVADEASRWSRNAWTALVTTLTATEGRVRVLHNVTNRRNWAWELARRAESGEDPDMLHRAFTIDTALRHGLVRAEDIELARRTLTESEFAALYYNEAADDGSNPFGIDHIRACITSKSTSEPVAWGIDLGMEVDWTVAIGLDSDGHVCRFGRWQHRPWPVTESHLAQMIGATPALLDATGLGSPVYGHLVQHIPQLEPFVFTGRSKQELIDSLIIAIQQGQIGYPDGQIVSELETMEATFTRTGVQYQAMSGMHDDCVMALALAWRMWLARPREQSVVETWDI